MEKEELIRWTSIPGLAEQHILQTFSFHNENMELILKQYGYVNPRKIKVTFFESVVMHRMTNESLRIAIDSPGFDNEGRHISSWPFYKVKNSQLVAWLLVENESLDENTLIHYMCSDAESYIDIVATKDPIITWLDEDLP